MSGILLKFDACRHGSEIHICASHNDLAKKRIHIMMVSL